MGGGTQTVLCLFLAVVTIAVDVSLVALGSKDLVVVAIVSKEAVGVDAGVGLPGWTVLPRWNGLPVTRLGQVVWLFSYVRGKIRLATIT